MKGKKDWQLKINELELTNEKNLLLISNFEERLQLKTNEIQSLLSKISLLEENERKSKQEYQDLQNLFSKIKEGKDKNISSVTLDWEIESQIKKHGQQREIVIEGLKQTIKGLEKELERARNEQIYSHETFEGKIKGYLSHNEESIALKEQKVNSLEIDNRKLNEKIRELEKEIRKIEEKVI